MAWATLAQHLDYERLLYGRDRRIAVPPPVLLELWERGRAAGYHLGALYVLDAPLAPGLGGSYHRETGDIWIYHEAEDADPAPAAGRLLHELAHAARRTRRAPATIEGYYRDEVATQCLAHTLARRWGVPHLLSAQARDAYITLMDRRCLELPDAGDLAGSHALHVASACHDDLRRLAQLHEWSDEQWEQALWGHGDGEAAIAAVAELDRCRLRPSWSLGWGHGDGFDALTLPLSSDAAHLVRGALTEVAGGRPRAASRLLRRRRTRGGTAYRQGYVPLWHGRDLTAALAAANLLLLGHAPWSAEATWSVYGTEQEPYRLYALDISYRAPIGERPGGARPLDARLWCPLLSHEGTVEAALQLYIRGWRRCAALRTGSLREGCAQQAEQESTVPR